jgi:RimJ/RimL family protein N-acetyltransferase
MTGNPGKLPSSGWSRRSSPHPSTCAASTRMSPQTLTEEDLVTINLLATKFATKYRRLLPHKAHDCRHAQGGGVRRRLRCASWLTVRVRPIRPDDAPLLNDVFARLGPASRLTRFLSPKKKLTAAEVRYLTDVDHRNHEALIAVTRRRGEALGVARFIRDPQDPSTAEVAMSVVDEWQNRGVGFMLATRLSGRAVSENVSHVTALMTASNVRARRLLAKIGEPTVIGREGATVSYRVALPGAVPAPTQRHSVGVADPTVRGCVADGVRTRSSRRTSWQRSRP